MAGYNESRPPYYYGAYNDRDGRLLYDLSRDAGRGYSFQEPYTDYRPYYGRTTSYDGRGGIVPMEEVYGRQEAPWWLNREHPHRGHLRGADHDDSHNNHHHRNKVELWVPMCCDKCERKVRKHLGFVEGVESITTDQWTKKVVVVGNVRPEFVLSRVQRDKPGAEYWSARHRDY